MIGLGDKFPRHYVSDYLDRGRHDAPPELVRMVEAGISDHVEKIAFCIAATRGKDQRAAQLASVPAAIRERVKKRVLNIFDTRKK